MIPTETITRINAVRDVFLETLRCLRDVPSFRTLCQTSAELEAEFERIAATAAGKHVREACSGEVTVAIIGSSGHGKTTILDELFPGLAERGWLETDVTDTTSQALKISFADRGDPGIDEVAVKAWSIEQVKHLMSNAEVREQNERDRIEVSYHDDSLVVDGTESSLDPKDLAEWRHARRIELEPFRSPYQVPGELCRDRKFIRALTVKEQSSVLETGPVLTHEGRAYDALQLRALVESVQLRDSFDRVLQFADGDDQQAKRLRFIDTPGLAVSSVAKDEVLRHYLGKKSNQIALELLRRDELDIVIHLVLCGRSHSSIRSGPRSNASTAAPRWRGYPIAWCSPSTA